MTKNNLEKKELIEKKIRQEKDMIENYERENNCVEIPSTL